MAPFESLWESGLLQKVQKDSSKNFVLLGPKLSLFNFFFVNDCLAIDGLGAASPRLPRSVTHRSMNLPLHAILNSIEDAILCLDDRLNILLLNEAAAQIFGCDAAQAAGQAASHYPALAEVVRQLNLSEVSTAGTASKAVRRVHLNRGDELTTLEAVVTSAFVDGKEFHTAVIRDVSVQQQMEAALFESRKTHAIGSLADGITLDFKSVLAAVISQIDLALHTLASP